MTIQKAIIVDLVINVLKYVDCVDENNKFTKILLAPDVIEQLNLYEMNDIYDTCCLKFRIYKLNIKKVFLCTCWNIFRTGTCS